jgi:hypothetical protein
MTTDIRTKASTDAYRSGWDRIFGTPDEEYAATTFGPLCDCAECNPQGDGFTKPMRMIVCGRCGSKRCPGADSHRNPCPT